MAAHPQISVDDARKMVEYIMSLGKEDTGKSLPLSGTVAPGKETDGAYLLTATYYDKGGESLPSLPASATVVLRSPVLGPDQASELNTVRVIRANGQVGLENVKHNSWAAYKNLDLTGVKKATINGFIMTDMTVTGDVEIHLDKPDGKLLGKVNLSAPGISRVSTKVEVVEGIHDLYFVFKNAKAGDKNLFFFGGASLENK
jgi:cytochrome c